MTARVTPTKSSYKIHLLKLEPYQVAVRDSKAKRKVVCGGRRGGKTVTASDIAVNAFMDGHRVLYATPTGEQINRFWYECTMSLEELIDGGAVYKNETEHVIEFPRTLQRIKAKTAWNADTLRGDFADLLILDEYQMMNEDAWKIVGAPMLLDNDGDAIFIYTPPSLQTAGVSKAQDPRHAAKLYKMAQNDPSGRWAAFHFSSHENPHISAEALKEITKDMSESAYRREILAIDEEESWIGLIYRKFNEKTCIKSRFEIPKSWLVYSGHDFGGANAAAMFYAQNPDTGIFVAFREYPPVPGRSTAQHIEAFKEITAGYMVFKSSGGSHQEQETRDGYGAHGWPIQEPNIGNVKAGIDRVIGMHEHDRIVVFDDLYHYLFEKQNYAWKLDPSGQPTGDIEGKAKYHLMDAERYLMCNFTPDTVATGDGPPVYSY